MGSRESHVQVPTMCWTQETHHVHMLTHTRPPGSLNHRVWPQLPVSPSGFTVHLRAGNKTLGFIFSPRCPQPRSARPQLPCPMIIPRPYSHFQLQEQNTGGNYSSICGFRKHAAAYGEHFSAHLTLSPGPAPLWKTDRPQRQVPAPVSSPHQRWLLPHPGRETVAWKERERPWPTKAFC